MPREHACEGMPMNLWFLVAPGLGAFVTSIGWLIRRYRKSLSAESETFRGFIIGTMRLRVGGLFSSVLASQLSARRYAQISLDSFPAVLPVPSMHDFRLDIDDAYVHLSLRKNGTTERVLDEELIRKNGPKRFSSMVIFGEPGSGKSTLTKKLFREECKRIYASPGAAPLPVHLELRSIDWTAFAAKTIEPGARLLNELISCVEQIKGIHGGEFVFRAFAGGSGVTIFLDGLDEIPSAYLDIACSSIQGLVSNLGGLGASKSSVILTGRTQLRSVLPRTFAETFDYVYDVEPFAPVDVFTFLQRWPFASNKTAEAARIFTTIEKNSSLGEMCSNPLALAMYVARDQLYVARGNGYPIRLPDTRTSFYAEIVSELLLYRREEQRGTGLVGSEVKIRRERLLGRIALAHMLNEDQSANSIPWAPAVFEAQQVLYQDNFSTAEAELRQLAIETGIFAEERFAESLRFLHLTLCEFLAAKELREHEANVLLKLVCDTAEPGNLLRRRLAEVIVFAAALTGRTTRQAVIAQLLNEKTSSTLPFRIIVEAQEYHPETIQLAIEKFIRDSTDQLISDERNAELYFILLCLRSANSLYQDTGRKILPTTTEVINRIAEPHARDRFSNVFDTFMTIDPESALLAARTRQMPELMEPARLARALQDPKVVQFAIQRVLALSDDCVTWCIALAEACLEHTLVSQMLYEEPRSDLLFEIVSSIPEMHAWHERGPVANTLYGQILSVATNNIGQFETGQNQGVRRVGILAELQAKRVLDGEPTTRQSVRASLNLAPRIKLPIRDGFVLFAANSGRGITWANENLPEDRVRSFLKMAENFQRHQFTMLHQRRSIARGTRRLLRYFRHPRRRVFLADSALVFDRQSRVDSNDFTALLNTFADLANALLENCSTVPMKVIRAKYVSTPRLKIASRSVPANRRKARVRFRE